MDGIITASREGETRKKKEEKKKRKKSDIYISYRKWRKTVIKIKGATMTSMLLDGMATTFQPQGVVGSSQDSVIIANVKHMLTCPGCTRGLYQKKKIEAWHSLLKAVLITPDIKNYTCADQEMP